MGFSSEVKDGVHVIGFPSEVDNIAIKQMETLVKQWQEVEASYHIYDFNGVEDVAHGAIRFLMGFNQSLKKQGKKFASINASMAIITLFQNEGILESFLVCKSMDEALLKIGKKKAASLNVEFVNPFLTATIHTLKVNQIEAKPSKPYLKKSDESPPFNISIAGVISVVSDQFNGTIAICFTKKVFLQIYENMLGEKHEEISAEMEDAAGELLNIIFGMAKAELNNTKGYTLQKAIPTILSGDKLNLRQVSNAQVLILPFETNAGPFHIEMLVTR